MKPSLTSTLVAVGAAAAGVALFEVALLPGLAIGVAAVVAPQLLPKRRRRATPADAAPHATRHSARRFLPGSLDDLAHMRFSRAVVKTVTFRVIVTSLDFTANYLVLRDPGVAAGLSAISVVGGPLFYFMHESAWNYLVGSGKLELLAQRLPAALAKNHPLVKTITYRTLATIIEFTTNYVVVGDLGTAALLSSFGFFLGPFVYYGHELAWERFGAPEPAPSGRRRAVIIDVEPEPA
jgi:uncharacterized membrane protein